MNRSILCRVCVRYRSLPDSALLTPLCCYICTRTISVHPTLLTCLIHLSTSTRHFLPLLARWTIGFLNKINKMFLCSCSFTNDLVCRFNVLFRSLPFVCFSSVSPICYRLFIARVPFPSSMQVRVAQLYPASPPSCPQYQLGHQQVLHSPVTKKSIHLCIYLYLFISRDQCRWCSFWCFSPTLS